MMCLVLVGILHFGCATDVECIVVRQLMNMKKYLFQKPVSKVGLRRQSHEWGIYVMEWTLVLDNLIPLIHNLSTSKVKLRTVVVL